MGLFIGEAAKYYWPQDVKDVGAAFSEAKQSDLRQRYDCNSDKLRLV